MSIPIPTCRECGDQDGCLQLFFSDILGVCIKCMNCDSEFPLTDVGTLFEEE